MTGLSPARSTRNKDRPAACSASVHRPAGPAAHVLTKVHRHYPDKPPTLLSIIPSPCRQPLTGTALSSHANALLTACHRPTSITPDAICLPMCPQAGIRVTWHCKAKRPAGGEQEDCCPMARQMQRYTQPVRASACPSKAPRHICMGETCCASSDIRNDGLEVGSVPADVALLSVAYDSNQPSGPRNTVGCDTAVSRNCRRQSRELSEVSIGAGKDVGSC